MKVSLFVFGLLVASSSAIRGHESSFRRLEREVTFSDEEINNAWTPKTVGRRRVQDFFESEAPSTAPSTALWNKSDKGGKGGSSPTCNDPPKAAGVDSTGMEMSAPTSLPTGNGASNGVDGDGDTNSPKDGLSAKDGEAPTSDPTGDGIPSGGPKDGLGHKDGEDDFPSSAPSSGDGEDSPTTSNGADGGTTPGNRTYYPSSAPSSGNDENIDATGGDGLLTRVVQCDVDESAFQDLTPKFVMYEYTVKTGESFTLREVLDEIESTILLALLNGNVLSCSAVRQLEANPHRRLDGVLRISADPPDAPSYNVDCEYDCNMLIQGNLTAYADEGTDLQVLECDIITVIQRVLNVTAPGEINGLEEITYTGNLMCETADGAATEVVKDTDTSNSITAGWVIGTAVGGMCMVLLGLLAVRQRTSRSREDDNTAAGITKEMNNSHSLSVTMDQTETQETIYPTPRNLEGSNASTLGISASPDDCSEWGGEDRKFNDIETARARSNSETSEITTSFGVISQQVSYDPSTMDATTAGFEPTVHEEEHLTHDIANLPPVSGADSPVAAETDILVETDICTDLSPTLAQTERI